MKKLLFIISFFLTLTSIHPNENIVIERSSFVLSLSIDEINYWEWTVPQSPYVFEENFIQLYPGESLFVEAEIADGYIINLTVVNEIVNENKTIIIEFNQITNSTDTRKHEFMMLKIINPFDKNLEYNADIYLIQYDRWINTSTIPVRAGISSYESWPDIIATIVLYDFLLK